MYKILFFLKKPVDDKILKHFNEKTIPILSGLTGKNVSIADVESNLLAEQKFSFFCEAEFNSKEEMDRIMNSKSGLELNKDIMDFHKHLSIITVNYK
ncbi:MAG TPA: EthD family reductase [Ignavibacteriaceae bacterium]|nr:EthD family reductase [Ignavibacteriaceae bacterium]